MPEADLVTYAPLENYSGAGKLFPGLTGTLSPEKSGDQFGASISRVPDLDGNGIAELLVGAPGKEGGGGRIGAGAVYLFMDAGDGLDENKTAAEARLRVLSENAGDHLGKNLSVCPDMDGDGYPELLMAAPDDQQLAKRAGRVTLLASRSLEELPAQVLSGSLSSTWVSDQAGAQLGRAISCAADFTGDDVPDILLGAPFEDGDGTEASGAVHLIQGGPNLGMGPVHEAASLRLSGDEDEAYFGSSLATGDVDGDGLADLLVGAPGAGNGDGSASLYRGADLQTGLVQAMALFQSGEPGSRLGSAVGLADMDGDGLADIFLGAPRANPEGLNRTFYSGVLYLFLSGSDLGLERPEGISTDEAYASWHEAQGYRRVGADFSLGDLDGDGKAELFLLMGDD
jgi:hypothetical protein